jgi:hypothetical protein
MHDEARVAATPETVGKFVKEGFTVLVEKTAGDGALYNDEEYVAAGATMIDNPQEIYDKAEMILKVKEPLFNEKLGKHEVEMMHKGQYLITFIHPASPVNHEMVKKLTAQGVTAITLDGIPRISRAQNLDALTSMSTCAGYKGILMAANHLTTFMPQMFTAVGQIKPAKVMVIGVGVAGLQALATAKRLGAITYAADIRPMASENAGSLGAKVVDTTVPPELAIGEGGYAEMPAASELTPLRDLSDFRRQWGPEAYDASLVDSMRYYLKLDSTTALGIRLYLNSTPASYSATVDGQEWPVTDRGGNVYQIEIPGVSAGNLGKAYHVVFTADDRIVYDIYTSCLSFADSLLADPSTPTDTRLAYTSLYYLYAAVRNHLDS